MLRMALLHILLLPCRFVLNGQTDSAKVETGMASYYANAFNGRKCSSGERFRQDSLTAAHKTLKFGTWVRVTSLKNDSSVIVKINDRLPSYSKRKIDLTLRAAKQLNFVKQGLVKVKIEVLSDSMIALLSKKIVILPSEEIKLPNK